MEPRDAHIVGRTTSTPTDSRRWRASSAMGASLVPAARSATGPLSSESDIGPSEAGDAPSRRGGRPEDPTPRSAQALALGRGGAGHEGAPTRRGEGR